MPTSRAARCAMRACRLRARGRARAALPQARGRATPACRPASSSRWWRRARGRSSPLAARRSARAPRRRSRARRSTMLTRGVLAEVLAALQRGDNARCAGARRTAAHAADPGDVIALIALGEALEAQRDLARAARAYGSLIDLFPSRADLRRFAGARLERLPNAGPRAGRRHLPARASSSAPITRRATACSPTRCCKQRRARGGVRGARARARAQLPSRPLRGRRAHPARGPRLVAAAWLRAEPGREPRVRAALARARRRARPRALAALRPELGDRRQRRRLPHPRRPRRPRVLHEAASCRRAASSTPTSPPATAPSASPSRGRARAYPYMLQAHYYSRGPMGYGMGKLQVVEHDGKGGLTLRGAPVRDHEGQGVRRPRAPAGPLS